MSTLHGGSSGIRWLHCSSNHPCPSISRTWTTGPSGSEASRSIEVRPPSTRRARPARSVCCCTAWENQLGTSSLPPRISAEDRKKYQLVVKKLDGFFDVICNIIMERRVGESAEQYITALYCDMIIVRLSYVGYAHYHSLEQGG